jgi:hypothetical protein
MLPEMEVVPVQSGVGVLVCDGVGVPVLVGEVVLVGDVVFVVVLVIVGVLVMVLVFVIVGVLVEVGVEVTVGVLVMVGEKVGVQVWPKPFVQGVLVVVKVAVAAGEVGLLLLEQAVMKANTPAKISVNIAMMRDFMKISSGLKFPG